MWLGGSVVIDATSSYSIVLSVKLYELYSLYGVNQRFTVLKAHELSQLWTAFSMSALKALDSVVATHSGQIIFISSVNNFRSQVCSASSPSLSTQSPSHFDVLNRRR
jgi:hypothetical protein